MSEKTVDEIAPSPRGGTEILTSGAPGITAGTPSPLRDSPLHFVRLKPFIFDIINPRLKPGAIDINLFTDPTLL